MCNLLYTSIERYISDVKFWIKNDIKDTFFKKTKQHIHDLYNVFIDRSILSNVKKPEDINWVTFICHVNK